jgi:hypothetical protein
MVEGPLAPGTYVTSVFSPTMTVTVGAGWTLESQAPGYLTLDIPSTRQLIDFVRVDLARVLSPPLGFDQESAAQTYADSRPVPADFFGYLRSTGYVDVSAPQPTVVGGLSSVAAVGVVRELPSQPGTCAVRTGPGPCFLYIGVPNPPPAHTFNSVPGEAVEWVLVPTHPGPLLVSIVGGPPYGPDELDAFLPKAEAVLATIGFASGR